MATITTVLTGWPKMRRASFEAAESRWKDGTELIAITSCPNDSAPIPTMICHYAAFLRAWTHAAPEISVNGNQAELRLTFGNKTLVAAFGCRKKNWSLRHIEIRRGEQTATFTRAELAKAMATLLGHEPLASTPQAINATSGPRIDATLRERRTTVIRV